ncbi:MAG: DUF192 domain-containing protein [Planctomycetota bacterium]
MTGGVARGCGGMALAVGVLLLLLPACDQGEAVPLKLGLHLLKVGEHDLWVEIASTPEARDVGMMHREELEDDHGMLFIFPTATRQGFWMKNCLIPLDIAYVDDDGKIIEILTMEAEPQHKLPSEYPRYPSSGPVRYAIETSAGWFESNAIEVGTLVEGIEGPPGLRPR